MNNFDVLTDDNFLMFAIREYKNPGCISKKEFAADLSRIKYVKRLFRRYLRNQDLENLRVRLVLNHIIILFNIFGLEATRILFFKLEPELWHILKPFLVFLNYLPDTLKGVNKKDIATTSIKMDKPIIDELRKI